MLKNHIQGVFSLSNSLATITKKSFSMTEYLREIWNVVDELAMVETPFHYDELSIKVLSGLG